jgi:hypothetical protein
MANPDLLGIDFRDVRNIAAMASTLDFHNVSSWRFV